MINYFRHTNWRHFLRDVGLNWGLTFAGGMIVGIFFGPEPILVRLGTSTIFLGTTAFTISGYLTTERRFQHLFKVSIGVWITGLINVYFYGVTKNQWLSHIPILLIMMAVGGGIATLIRKLEMIRFWASIFKNLNTAARCWGYLSVVFMAIVVSILFLDRNQIAEIPTGIEPQAELENMLPFEGMTVERVLYRYDPYVASDTDWTSPTEDTPSILKRATSLGVYKLKDFDVDRWVTHENEIKKMVFGGPAWKKGPITDNLLFLAFKLADLKSTREEKLSQFFEWEKWVNSSFIFHFYNVTVYSGYIYAADIWVLDSNQLILYHITTYPGTVEG